MKILWKLNWAAVLAVCINTSSADPAWLKIDLKTALANFQLLLKVSMESSNVFAQCKMCTVHVLGHRAASPIHPISPKWTTLEVEIRFRTGEVVTFKLQTNFFSSPVYIPLLLTLNLSTFLGRCFLFHFILVDLIQETLLSVCMCIMCQPFCERDTWWV